MFISSQPLKAILAFLAVLTATVSGYSDTQTILMTNSFLLQTTGSNAVIRISQGTNTVILPTQGAGTLVQVMQISNTVPPPPTYPWESSVAAGVALTRGNSDTTLLTTKIGTHKKKLDNEYIFGADAAYGETDGTQNQDSIHGVAQYNHLFDPRTYAFANAEALHDGIQDLKYRITLSPGAGYYFVKTKPTSLVGEIGPGMVSEDRGDVNNTYLSLRLAEHFDQRLNATARLWEKAEIIPEVNNFENYVVNAEIGVETALTKKLSLQVVFDESYVNQPAAGRAKNDVKLVSGIAYKF
jgi:putative salt-induced outer membrane protein YdiY